MNRYLLWETIPVDTRVADLSRWQACICAGLQLSVCEKFPWNLQDGRVGPENRGNTKFLTVMSWEGGGSGRCCSSTCSCAVAL